MAPKQPKKKRCLRKGNPPLIEGMLEVTPKNKKHLERVYNIEISADAAYILPPNLISDENSDFWDIEKSLHIKREKRGERKYDGFEEIE